MGENRGRDKNHRKSYKMLNQNRWNLESSPNNMIQSILIFGSGGFLENLIRRSQEPSDVEETRGQQKTPFLFKPTQKVRKPQV